ncbi:hemerythrin domain-containing protein [Streptomyces collinus]|uniref:hemerythrin domain-containing protein n=1 Tax=Streptomyces collinus TaxID=42684 RepID=UPI003641A109
MTPTRDVVEVILEDHRTMEELLRLMRSTDADRPGALHDFAHLMIAHGEAERTSVHPVLTSFGNADTVEHIEAAHKEAVKVLFALLQVREVSSVEWEWRLQQLAGVTGRHTDEEERTLVNRVRESLSRPCREELGAGYVRTKSDLLAARCGSLANVHRLVRAAAPV